MLIEALVRWTEMALKKEDKQEAFLRRIVDGDLNPGSLQPEFYYDFSPMVFDIRDVGRFNRAKDPGYTTIRFRDGDGAVIKIPYLEFVDLYIELTGQSIRDALPSDYVDPEEEARDNETDTDLEI
jgi:hypothetical protein